MSLIKVSGVSLEFAGNYVLSDVSCTLETNSRTGLIGSNGSGKSTLIRLMLGELAPTRGEVLRAKKCRVAYLPQAIRLDPDLKLIDHVLASRPELLHLSAMIHRLSRVFELDRSPQTEARLSSAVEEYTSLGGYEFDNEVKYVLTSLSFPPDTWDKAVGLFSGGEQTRICLAAILLMPYDLLILDEPTNHLDLSMIAWLEKYLLKQGKPYLVVSHDRQFLDNTVSTIFSLREGALSVTKGNYSSYKAADEIARLSQEREYERQQKFIAETRDFIQKNIAGQKTNQAKSRLKMLDRLELVQKPGAEKQVKLSLATSRRSGNDVYILDQVRFGIPPDLELAREVSLKAHYRDRICVLGPNGCGKTTLLKILIGEHGIFEGRLKTGASLDIGYFDQHQISLEEGITVMDTIWQLVPSAPRGYVLAWLARFGFRGDEVEKSVSVLSGGEKSRLYLCVLIHQNPNLLILDEPTNHLDIAMTDALLEALQAYQGTIIFVSHDRFFLSELATRFWVFRRLAVGNNTYTTIEEPDCDAQKAIELSFEVPEAEQQAPPPRTRKKRINPWHLDQLHLKIEDKTKHLKQLELDLNQIHLLLSRSETYADESKLPLLQAEMAALEERISLTRETITDLEDQYLALSYES
jgi:ATP-binding cassette subfamily F protein 3